MTTLLAIGYLGAITNLMTDAKSLFGALAAMASFIASCYAIAIARKKLKQIPSRKPSRSSRTSRLKIRRLSVLAFSLQPLALAFALATLSACSTNSNSGPRTQSSNLFARLAQFPATILDSAAKLVTTTTTNVIEQAVVTATDVVTQDSQTFILTTNTTLITNYTLVTNISAEVKPAAEKSIAIANTASTFLPPPYGELAAGILALATAGLTAAVRRRNAMLKTVIDGVEKAGVPAVKEEISTASMRDGTAPDLHALVKQITNTNHR
jgi:hypothetical protein